MSYNILSFLSIYSFLFLCRRCHKSSLWSPIDVKLNSPMLYMCCWPLADIGRCLDTYHSHFMVWEMWPLFIMRKYFVANLIPSPLWFLDRFWLTSISFGMFFKIFQFKSSLWQCRKRKIMGTLAADFLSLPPFLESSHSLLCCSCHPEVFSYSSLPHWFSICFTLSIFLVTHVLIWCKYAAIQSVFTLSPTISGDDLL